MLSGKKSALKEREEWPMMMRRFIQVIDRAKSMPGNWQIPQPISMGLISRDDELGQILSCALPGYSREELIPLATGKRAAEWPIALAGRDHKYNDFNCLEVPRKRQLCDPLSPLSLEG